MKHIYYFSTFDPITNKELDFIQNYKEDCFFHFFMLKGEEPIEHRTAMIKLVLNNINYEVIDYQENSGKVINLTDFFNENCSTESYLLLEDEEMTLVPSETVINYKFKLKLNENIISQAKDIRSLNNLHTNIKIVDYIVDNRLYFMRVIEKYYKPKRLIHAISVARLAYKIAESNNLQDKDLFYITGLLHDIAKTMSDDEALEIIEKYYPRFSNAKQWEYHEMTGAFLAKKLFPKINNKVVNAIFVHTTGKANMNELEKVIYSADDIEPTRDYDSQFLIDACINDYEKGFLQTMKEVIKFNGKESGDGSILLQECIKYYKVNNYE